MRLRTAGLALLLFMVLATPAGAATRGLGVGFLDDLFYSPNSTDRTWAFDAARHSGGDMVRLNLFWRSVAPTHPATPQDPNDPAYHWGAYDAGVRDAQARGLTVLITITSAPPWAEGARRSRSAAPGTWKPSPRSLQAFAAAAARRYPTVTRWQIWNEPNLNVHLMPQWTRRHGHLTSASGPQYRKMLNAAYAGFKSVNRRITVVTAGAAPYGDSPGLLRTRPVTFWQAVLKRVTRFDVFAHHPYSVYSPRRHALSSADVSVPDVTRLTRLVKQAVRRGIARPKKAKPLWITELGWDSNPPDPHGVPARRQAAWLADAFFVLWKQHAAKVVWTFVRDQPPTGGYDVTYQSGVYLLNDRPKSSRRAISFPVACEHARHGRLRVWGKAPARGKVTLLRRGVTVGRLTAGRSRVFVTTVPGRAGVGAKQGNRTSLRCVPA